MNILFYQSSLSAKIIFNVSEKLEKNFNIKVAHIHKKSKENSQFEKNLFHNSNKKIFLIDVLANDNLVDYKYLDYFEKNIAKCNIWKSFSFDRDYGAVYLNDINCIDKKKYSKNQDLMLSNFVLIARQIEKIFVKFKPNYVYIPNGLSGIETSIIESFAIFYKVKILNPEPYRFKNFFYFSKQLGDPVNPNIRKNYIKTKKKYKKNKNIDKIYQEIISKKSAFSIDAKYTLNNVNKQKKKSILLIYLKFIYSFLKHLFFKIIFSLNLKIKHLKYLKEYNVLRFLKIEFQTMLNTNYLYKIKPPNLNTNYIYFPLHLIPETTSLVKGNNYTNQENLIECLSKKIPSDYKLYVKEHPNQIYTYPRKMSFYKRIQSLPNVELLNPLEDVKNIISKAMLVIVINGSSGFEALFYNVPSLYLENSNYSFLNFSVENKNLNSLYFDIKKTILLKKNINKKKHIKKIKILIQSIMDNGYNLRDAETFYYFKKNSTDGEKICTEDLYLALVKELKLKKN